MESRLQEISSFVENMMSRELPKGMFFSKSGNGSILFENPYEVKDDDSVYHIYLYRYVESNSGLPEAVKYGIQISQYEPVKDIIDKIRDGIKDLERKSSRVF